MTVVPPNPKIYHITPFDNLENIIRAGELRSDALMVKAGGPAVTIGMGKLKRRRLEELSIECLGGVMVGECVPFYFCPRSVMLFLIHNLNQEVAYRGGQEPIVHLEADLGEVLTWAEDNGRPWAFSLTNAAARYTEFRAARAALSEVNWVAVAARDWRGLKEPKQAEFLIKDTFPWHLFRVIGVRSSRRANQVTQLLQQLAMEGATDHAPLVQYSPSWYY